MGLWHHMVSRPGKQHMYIRYTTFKEKYDGLKNSKELGKKVIITIDHDCVVITS